ncbi:collagen alpha-1(IX) chain-like [Aplochiton taeniatus]
MSQFHIAELARRGTVKKVVGPNPQKVAYKIDPTFNFRINTRSAYPLGIPGEFALMTVLRMDGSTISKSWNLWQVQDLNGEEQLAIRLNGESKSIEIRYTTFAQEKQNVAFTFLPFLFNSKWHKILLKVNESSMSLFVDCIMIDSQNIPPRQKIKLDGFTLIGKFKDNPAMAVPVRPLSFMDYI